MKFKTIAVLILFVLAIGAGVAFFVMFQHQQMEAQATQQLLQAQALLQEGARENALSLLTDLTQRYPRFSNMPQVLLELAQASEGVAPDQSLAAWEELLSRYPEHPLALEAHRAAGRLALERGQIATAEQHFQVLEQSNQPHLQGSAVLGRAAIAESRGDVEKAREMYYQVIEYYASDPDVTGEAMDRLSRINTDYLLSPSITEFSQRYEVQPGDNLISIANRFQTTVYLLRAMNNGSDRLRARMRMTVPKPGGVRLKVVMNEMKLYVYSQMEGTEGKFIKRYPVGVARYRERTPPGVYVIQDKQIDPTWYPPEGGIIPPGDPRNALGSRWMGFTRDGRQTSLGIHGNNDPETIGTNASAGCIRMYNEDVEELFMIARQGTEVEIVE